MTIGRPATRTSIRICLLLFATWAVRLMWYVACCYFGCLPNFTRATCMLAPASKCRIVFSAAGSVAAGDGIYKLCRTAKCHFEYEIWCFFKPSFTLLLYCCWLLLCCCCWPFLLLLCGSLCWPSVSVSVFIWCCNFSAALAHERQADNLRILNFSVQKSSTWGSSCPKLINVNNFLHFPVTMQRFVWSFMFFRF